MIIKEDIIPEMEEIIALYEDVQWSAYTNDPENLKKAIDNLVLCILKHKF